MVYHVSNRFLRKIKIYLWSLSIFTFPTQPGPTFFDPTWTHILAPKDPNMEFHKQNFNFQSLRNTEAILLPIMWLKDWLAKVKTSKIITFCYFWTKMDKNLVQIPFKCSISSYFGLQFPLRYFPNQYVLLLNVFLIQNMKKPVEIPVSLFFFTTLDLIWPKCCPKDHTHFPFFFAHFQWNMLVRGFN